MRWATPYSHAPSDAFRRTADGLRSRTRNVAWNASSASASGPEHLAAGGQHPRAVAADDGLHGRGVAVGPQAGQKIRVRFGVGVEGVAERVDEPGERVGGHEQPPEATGCGVVSRPLISAPGNDQ